MYYAYTPTSIHTLLSSALYPIIIIIIIVFSSVPYLLTPYVEHGNNKLTIRRTIKGQIKGYPLERAYLTVGRKTVANSVPRNFTKNNTNIHADNY